MKKTNAWRGKRTWIFFSLIFILFLILLEIILRSTHLFGTCLTFSKPDPILGYRYIPGRYTFYKENDHPVEISINRSGWRDEEWSRDKPDHVYRIAVLGDSFIEAFQIEQEKTFLARAEHLLHKSCTDSIQFMNFSRSGFTQTDQLYVLQKEASLFHPDMVILFFFPFNDIQDVNRETANSVQRPFIAEYRNDTLTLDTGFSKTHGYSIRRLVNAFKRRSAFITLAVERLTLLRSALRSCTDSGTQEDAETPAEKRVPGWASLCTAHPDPVYLANYQLNRNLIRSMAVFCKRRGIKFMLVTIDPFLPVKGSEEKYRSRDGTLDPYFFEKDLEGFSDSLSIEYIGLQSIFREHREETGESLHWHHWNYQGHRVVADTISNKLRELLHCPSF